MGEKHSEVSLLNSAVKNAFIMLMVQAVSVVLGLIINFVLPVYITVESYGYWQVYILYESYAACFFLGYNDGIYLRYGDYDYSSLPKEKLRGSNSIFVIISIVISLLLCLLAAGETDTSKIFSMTIAFFNIAILGINAISTYVYQITNQIKKYSFFSLLIKILSLSSILFLVAIRMGNFKYFVIADFSAKIILILAELWSLRDLFFGKRCGISESVKEYISNVKVGFFLMLSNLTGTLILGLGKFIAERGTTIGEYAKYSFANSSANLILVGITAISLVVYPTLKRLREDKYCQYYSFLKLVISILTSIMLLLYFPLNFIVDSYITKYASMFTYLPFLFVAVYMQCRMQLVNNSFYNAMRKEKKMLVINLAGVILFLIIALPWYVFTYSVKALAVSTMISSVFRCICSEIIIEKSFNIKNVKSYLIDLVMIGSFLVCSLGFEWYQGCIIFIVLNTIRCFVEKECLKQILLLIKGLIRKDNKINEKNN